MFLCEIPLSSFAVKNDLIFTKNRFYFKHTIMKNRILRSILMFFLLFATSMIHAQKQRIFISKFLPQADTVQVFIPNDPDSLQKKYACVYLLHGWSGSYKSWGKLLDMQKLSDRYKFIFVCPDGFYNSFYLNSPLEKTMQFESFFVEELMPEINKNFRTDTAKTFITGLSMGGHGALTLFFKHSDLFLSAGSSSGVLDLSYSSQKSKSLAKWLGEFEKNRQRFYEASAIFLCEKNVNSMKSFILDCGTNDHLYECNTNFYSKAMKLKLPAVFISMPGDHNAAYWKNSFLFHFDFFYNLANK